MHFRVIEGGNQPAKSGGKPALQVVDDTFVRACQSTGEEARARVQAMWEAKRANVPASELKPPKFIDGGPMKGLAYIVVRCDLDKQINNQTRELWLCDGLSDWERDFIRGVRLYHAKCGLISWKQQMVIDKMCDKHLRKRKPRKR